MIYEALVIKTEIPGYSAKAGEMCAVRPKGWEWGKAELTDRFAIIEIDLPSDDHANELQKPDYYYHFDDAVFKRVEDEKPFDPDVVVSRKDLPAAAADISDQMADLVDPLWRNKAETSCQFLNPEYMPYPDGDKFGSYRKYWVEKFSPLVKSDGIKDLIAAFSFGDYGDIAKVARALEGSVKDLIMVSPQFTKDDLAWFKKVWGYADDNN